MKPARIYQATDKTFSVQHDFTDLTTATEINIYVDTPSQIVKSLGNGVTSVTDETFLLTFNYEDTDNVGEGEYLIDGYVTTATGDRVHARISPNKVKILPTNWASARDTRDY